MLGALALPQAVQARIDPLWQMTVPPVKAEVMLLLDTSASMNCRVSDVGCAYDDRGNDCTGQDPAVNLPGDFMCTGWEVSPAADCAGMPKQCETTTTTITRIAMAKRAVQNVLVDYADKASIALATFGEGTTWSPFYFQYHSTAAATTQTTAIFLSELELRSSGSWTLGAGWASGPAASFTGPDAATVYTLLAAAGNNNSLYRRPDGTGSYLYKRLSYAGPVYNDGNDWKYIGSYYSFAKKDGPYGAAVFITAAGTAIPASVANLVSHQYRGPQFVIGATTYVHEQASYNFAPYSNFPSTAVKLLTPFHQDNGSSTLADFEATSARALNRVNTVFNGGVTGMHMGTPNGRIMTLAAQVFKDRAQGFCDDASIYGDSTGDGVADCPYTVPDPFKACRPRFAILVTDGAPTDSGSAVPARKLYCQGCNDPTACCGGDLANCNTGTGADSTNCDPATSNPIKTVGIGIPSTTADLTGTADWGWDGVSNGDQPAFTAANEAQLTSVIGSVLASAIAGDFVTTSGSAASSDPSAVGDYGLVTSVEYPGWKGHLRAFDLTQDPAVEVWDLAGTLNALANPYSRRIFTGEPRTDAGAFQELLDTTGNLVDEAKLKAVATATGSTTVAGLNTTDLTNFIRWVYGNGRTDRLGPIIRSVPAVVGPPPQRYLENHGLFESTQSGREQIIYVASNEGLIHAVRSGKVADGGGSEIFAFLPPNLLDKVYQLYLSNGQTSINAYKWIMAASPRVDDLYDGSSWTTQLLQPFGPKSYGFMQLDITSPTDSSKNLVPANLKVVALLYGSSSAGKLRTATNDDKAVTIGEAWSHPALYWTVAGTNTSEQRMSMGNGYGAASSADMYRTETAGHAYYYFDSLWDTAQPKSTFTYTPGAGVLKVDYAAITDTVAVMNNSGTVPRVIATYQADLDGRIMRYKEGMTGAAERALIIPGSGTDNPNNPFFYSPAALHIGGTADNTVLLAAASGSADEPSPPAPSLETTLYLRSETEGTVSATDFKVTCAIGALSTCIPKDPSITEWPTNKAKPVTSPLIMYASGTTGAADVYYLLYEPTAATGCSTVGGNSWLVHIQVTNATTFETKEVVKVAGKRAGGYVVTGGMVMITTSNTSGGTAGVHSKDGALPPPSPFLGTPRVEVWREVR
jgi:hypothetical protein